MVGDRYRLPTLSICEQAELDRLRLLRLEQNLSWEDELQPEPPPGRRRSRRGGSNNTACRAAACTAGRH